MIIKICTTSWKLNYKLIIYIVLLKCEYMCVCVLYGSSNIRTLEAEEDVKMWITISCFVVTILSLY